MKFVERPYKIVSSDNNNKSRTKTRSESTWNGSEPFTKSIKTTDARQRPLRPAGVRMIFMVNLFINLVKWCHSMREHMFAEGRLRKALVQPRSGRAAIENLWTGPFVGPMDKGLCRKPIINFHSEYSMRWWVASKHVSCPRWEQNFGFQSIATAPFGKPN